MSTFPVPIWNGRRAVVSSGYGTRRDGFHYGTDLTFVRMPHDAPLNNFTYEGGFFHPFGLPALAADDGVVTRAHVTKTGGHIWVEHDERAGAYWTQYIHLVPGSFEVQVGDRVREGQPLAEIGYNLLHTDGDLIHLHFQLGLNGELVDPEPYVEDWEAVANPWGSSGIVTLGAIGLAGYTTYRLLRRRQKARGRIIRSRR